MHDKDTWLYKNKRGAEEEILETTKLGKISYVIDDICHKIEQIGVGL